MRLEALVGGKVYLLGDTIGVIEIDIGKDVTEESFSALESVFQCFDILRGWIASSIRWLVIGTICVKERLALCI